MSAAAPARRCAYAVVRRVFERSAFADRALHSAASGLDARDRALATRLVYGTVQRRGTLDAVIAELARRPVAALAPEVLAALRLGLYQLLYLDSVPDHAAVDDAVTLAATAGAGPGAGLVNAVLRRATDEARAQVAALGDETPERAAVCHSLPLWLTRMWWRELGAEQARELMATVNRPAESALRANTLAGAPDEVAAGLGVRGHRDPDLPEAIVLEEPFDAHGSAAWREGRIMPQARASMLVSRLLAPRAGESVLDLCAAPGAKTTHLAALMQDSGEVVAVERHGGRARALERTAARMGARSVSVVRADASRRETVSRRFQRVLLDPPCSGLGTLRSRPDLRWRARPESITELAALQARMLDVAAEAVAPGGTLVYSTCTLSAAENERQIGSFLRRRPEFAPAAAPSGYEAWQHPSVPGAHMALPHRHDTDGFFIARLVREPEAPRGAGAG